MYCSLRTGGSSPTDFCHALSSHHPVHLHLGQQVQYIHPQGSQTTTGVLTTFPTQTSFCKSSCSHEREPLPRQLLVSALTCGKCSVGGQKCRWNDLLVRDLKKFGLAEDWRRKAMDRQETDCKEGSGACKLMQRVTGE